MSNKDIIVYGKVDSAGLLTISNKGLFYDSIAKRYAGKNVEIAVRVKHKPKSNGQLGYYFGFCLSAIIAELEETQGEKFSKDRLDIDLRTAFLYEEEVDLVTGEIKKYTKSLKDLSTYEMMLYIEEVRKWAASTLFLDIPDPNPNWQHELEQEKQKQKQINI